MKPAKLILFVAGVVVGSVATNFFNNIQGQFLKEHASNRWVQRPVSEILNGSIQITSVDAYRSKGSVYDAQVLSVEPPIRNTERAADTIPDKPSLPMIHHRDDQPQNETLNSAVLDVEIQEYQYDLDIIDELRPLWSKLILKGVYPSVNNGRPTVRTQAYPPDVCFSAGTPISKNWTLLSTFADQKLSLSAERALKPEPQRRPYRGHVKVCMHWNPSFWWQGYWREFGTCVGDDYCDLPCGNIHCRYSWRSENWNDCSAVILHHHLDSYVGNAPYLRKVLALTEPLYKEEVEQALGSHNREMRKDIDVVAHWHRSANVFLAAHNNQFSKRGEEDFAQEMNFGYLNCPPRPEVARTTCVERRMGVTVFNHGNCHTPGGFRENYVRELRRYIRVDAYAACLHNKARPKVKEWTFQQEVELRSNYKFALAFENELSEDWVTEKVFHALAAGTVPVYYGAPNVHEFLPCTGCIIEVAKFASAKDLAKYLIYLDQNPDQYMRYHAWRERPMRVPPTMEASKAYSYCGVCRAVADDIEGNLTRLEWGGPDRWWIPDSDAGRRAKPPPPTWDKGFD